MPHNPSINPAGKTLDKGEKLNDASSSSPDEASQELLDKALREAIFKCEATAVGQLLDDGAKVDKSDAAAAFQYACRQPQIAILLLESGMAFDATKPDETPPLVHAVRIQDESVAFEIVRVAMAGTGLRDDGEYLGRVAFHSLIEDKPRIFEFMVERLNTIGALNLRGFFVDSAPYLSPSCAQALVRAGGDVCETDEDGRSALMAAIQGLAGKKGHGQLMDMVNFLILHGAVLDHAAKEGDTALMHAARSGFTPLVERLVMAGAQVEKRDNSNLDALLYGMGSVDALERKQRKKALDDKEAMDLLQRWEVAELLLRHGAALPREEQREAIGFAPETWVKLDTLARQVGLEETIRREPRQSSRSRM